MSSVLVYWERAHRPSIAITASTHSRPTTIANYTYHMYSCDFFARARRSGSVASNPHELSVTFQLSPRVLCLSSSTDMI